MHPQTRMSKSSAAKLFSVPMDSKEPKMRPLDERDRHGSGARVAAGVVGLGLLLLGVDRRHTTLGRVAIGVGVAALELAVTGYFPSVIRTVGLARHA